MEFGFKNCGKEFGELLWEEIEKVFASVDTAFENSLKKVFSGNVQVARACVIKNDKHLA